MDTNTPKRLQEWLEHNKDAVGILGKKIKEIDTVKGCDEKELRARQLAIKIIEGWISEVYGIAWSSEFIYPEDEDQIIKYLEKPVN